MRIINTNPLNYNCSTKYFKKLCRQLAGFYCEKFPERGSDPFVLHVRDCDAIIKRMDKIYHDMVCFVLNMSVFKGEDAPAEYDKFRSRYNELLEQFNQKNQHYITDKKSEVNFNVYEDVEKRLNYQRDKLSKPLKDHCDFFCQYALEGAGSSISSMKAALDEFAKIAASPLAIDNIQKFASCLRDLEDRFVETDSQLQMTVVFCEAIKYQSNLLSDYKAEREPLKNDLGRIKENYEKRRRAFYVNVRNEEMSFERKIERYYEDLNFLGFEMDRVRQLSKRGVKTHAHVWVKSCVDKLKQADEMLASAWLLEFDHNLLGQSYRDRADQAVQDKSALLEKVRRCGQTFGDCLRREIGGLAEKMDQFLSIVGRPIDSEKIFGIRQWFLSKAKDCYSQIAGMVSCSGIAYGLIPLKNELDDCEKTFLAAMSSYQEKVRNGTEDEDQVQAQEQAQIEKQPMPIRILRRGEQLADEEKQLEEEKLAQEKQLEEERRLEEERLVQEQQDRANLKQLIETQYRGIEQKLSDKLSSIKTLANPLAPDTISTVFEQANQLMKEVNVLIPCRDAFRQQILGLLATIVCEDEEDAGQFRGLDQRVSNAINQCLVQFNFIKKHHDAYCYYKKLISDYAEAVRQFDIHIMKANQRRASNIFEVEECLACADQAKLSANNLFDEIEKSRGEYPALANNLILQSELNPPVRNFSELQKKYFDLKSHVRNGNYFMGEFSNVAMYAPRPLVAAMPSAPVFVGNNNVFFQPGSNVLWVLITSKKLLRPGELALTASGDFFSYWQEGVAAQMVYQPTLYVETKEPFFYDEKKPHYLSACDNPPGLALYEEDPDGEKVRKKLTDLEVLALSEDWATHASILNPNNPQRALIFAVARVMDPLEAPGESKSPK